MEDQSGKKPFIIPKTRTSNKGTTKSFLSEKSRRSFLLSIF